MKITLPSLVGWLAVVGAVLWSAWMWTASARSPGWSDGARVISTDSGLRQASWGEPRPLEFAAALTGFARVDGRPTLSADGRLVVFAAVNPDGPVDSEGRGHDLFVSELRDGALGEPKLLRSLSSDADDFAPAFGGEWLYFSSDRPGGPGGYDLWRARLDHSHGESQWLAPELVSGTANTAGDEFDPAPLEFEPAIVFAAERGAGKLDLFLAPLGDGPCVRLEGLCTPASDREPTFTHAGRALVFASDRAEGAGGFDLYRAGRFDSQFGAPESLAPLNSDADERAPFTWTDELALGFSRSGGEAEPLLLRSPAIELFRAPAESLGWIEWLTLASLLALALLSLLVRRHPDLDLLYKCLLASILAHLFLMWWFRDAWLNIGVNEREPTRAPMQVRLEEPEREPVVVASPPTPMSLPKPEPERPPSEALATPERAEIARNSAPSSPETSRLPAPIERAEELVSSSLPRELDAMPRAPSPVVERFESSAAAQPAEPAPEVALPAPATANTAGRELSPQRFDTQPSAPIAAPRADPVAARAVDSSEIAARAPADVAAQRSSVSANELADSAVAATTAGPAPTMDLDALAGKTAATTSRSMGTPSRAAGTRSLGSPAAGPAAMSVTRASERESRPGGATSEASTRLSPGRSQVSQGSPNAGAHLGDGASAACPAATMDLSSMAAASSNGAGAGARGPQRALGGHAAVRGAPSAPVRESTSIAEPRPEDQRLGRSDAVAPSPGAASRREIATAIDLDASQVSPLATGAAAAPQLNLVQLGSGAVRDGAQAASASGEISRASFDVSPRTTERPGASSVRAELSPPREGARGPGPSKQLAGAVTPGRSAAPMAIEEVGAPVGASASVASAPADLLSGMEALESARGEDPSMPPRGPERSASNARAREPAARAADTTPLARAAPVELDTPSRPARSPWEATPYQNRSGAEKARALKLHGGSESTEAAVARGLAYLARIQSSDGSWGDLRAMDEKYGRVAIGKTALCTLAFLGAGHTPDSAGEHSAVVSRAVDFLLSVQDAKSGHFGDSSAYDHGIATYALAECFALTRDQRLSSALERALAQVLATQSTEDDDRQRGGWGYYFSDGSLYDPWSRTSITAWQVMALESARLSGLSVPDEAFEAAREFLVRAFDRNLGAYRYSHEPERLRSAYATLPASTPAALFALALLGDDITGPNHERARDYTLQRAPDGYRFDGEMEFVRRGQGNPYFWYYGTLAMFRVGGAPWQRWNTALQETLLPAQERDGSWVPIDPYARYARDRNSDRSYTTAMCVLSLEIYYRYYLPLLKVR